MQCTLYIPRLLPPRAPDGTVAFAGHAPHLQRMLARARHASVPAADDSTRLCAAFGVSRQSDAPLAPMLASHAGLPAAQGYWICATPVFLETRRTALLLNGPDALQISADESAALVATLAANLREEQLVLHAPRADQWFIQCDTTPALRTTDLDTVRGGDVREYLPQGADSRRWHRLMTEMQMLLHAHPVNQTRDAAGRPPVNSVWLWGGGTLPTVPTGAAAAFDVVWSNDVAVCALAHHTGARLEAEPARLAPAQWDGARHLLATHALQAPLQHGELAGWREALGALDANWFQPLLAAVQARTVNQLTIISGDQEHTHRFQLQPGDLFKFWRKNKYL